VVADIAVGEAGVVDADALLDALAAAAATTGVEAHIVGGFVRDRLLGREGKDVDLVVIGASGGTAALLSAVAEQLGWSPPQLFEEFGTGHVRGGEWIVEAVEARLEVYDASSRRPVVRAGTLEEDVWRRDFTVNALVQTFSGRLLDITGRGVDDLVARVLRTPLDPVRAFDEDPLRMLRAARFAAKLDFEPVDELIAAMRDRADRVAILSTDRVRDELRGLLIGRRPSRGLETLRRGGLLERLLPEVAAMRGVEQSGHHVHDVYDHTLHALDAAPADIVTRTAVLLHDVGKPPCHAVDGAGRHTFHEHPRVGAEMATAILERLNWPQEEIRDVAALVLLHLRPMQFDPATFSDSAVRRLVRDAGALRDRLLDVARADIIDWGAGIDELAERMRTLDAGGTLSTRRHLVDSALVMELGGAGRGPGPWVGEALRALDDAVVDGLVDPSDRESVRRWLEANRPDLLGGSATMTRSP
jgi:poly(A) polymerase